MSVTTTDVIDHLLDAEPGGRIDRIRAARPDARENAQRSYEALFAPGDTTHVGVTERHVVAAFVAGLHRVAPVAGYYAGALSERDPRLAGVVAEEVARGL